MGTDTTRRVQELNHSLYVNLTKEAEELLGIEKGQEVNVKVADNDHVVIEPHPTPKP